MWATTPFRQLVRVLGPIVSVVWSVTVIACTDKETATPPADDLEIVLDLTGDLSAEVDGDLSEPDQLVDVVPDVPADPDTQDQLVDVAPDVPTDPDTEEGFDVGLDPALDVSLDVVSDYALDPSTDPPIDPSLDVVSDPTLDTAPDEGDMVVAPVSVIEGEGWISLNNGIAFARAFEDGTFEVGAARGVPFVMQRTSEDYDIICITNAGTYTCDGLSANPPLAPEHAASIAQSVPPSVVDETCVRTTYSGFPVSEAAGLSLIWDVCMSPGSDQVTVRLDVNGETDDHSLEYLYFPYAPPLSPQGEGYAVIPIRHGLILPVGWLVTSAHWTSSQLYPGLGTVGVFQYQAEPACIWLPMAFFGVVEDDGRALYVENHSHPDTGVRIRQVLGAEPRVTPRFRSQLGRFDNGSVRELVYVPMGGADYVEMAHRYRQYVIDIGRHVSLTEKVADRPNLDRLIGGAEIAAYTCFYHASDPDPALTVRSTFADVQANVEAVATAVEYPITRGAVHVDGWGQRGYDNLHPDIIYPEDGCVPRTDGSSDCGPCALAGGYAGLAALSEYLEPVDDQHQFLLELHDNYRDYYLDAQSYSDDEAIRLAGGILPDPHDYWDGGLQRILCASRALGYLQRNYDLLEDHGIVPTAVYLDVFSAVGPDECYAEGHPMTRAECLAYRASLLSDLLDRGMVVSSEQPADWAVPYIDHVYRSGYFRYINPDLPSSPRRNGYLGYNTSIGIPVPLWDLVYHDAQITPWPVLEGDRGENLLDAWLNAGIAEVELSELLISHRVRHEVSDLMNLHRAVGTQAMVDHRFVDERYMTQEAEFAGGGVTTTDRIEQSVASSGIPGVETGPRSPNPWYQVTAFIESWEYSAPNLQITLTWTTWDDLSALSDRRCFLHARDDTGIAANGDHWPENPTSTWVVGEPENSGPATLTLPGDGQYTIVAGLYHSTEGRLPIVSYEQFSLLLAHVDLSEGVITVDSRPIAEAKLVAARQVGDWEVEVMTEWMVGQPMPEGLGVFFHVNDGERIIENQDYWPEPPVDEWPYLGRRREIPRVLTFAPGEVPGVYTLYTGMWYGDPEHELYGDRIPFADTDEHSRFVLGTLLLFRGTERRINGIRFCPGNIAGCLGAE